MDGNTSKCKKQRKPSDNKYNIYIKKIERRKGTSKTFKQNLTGTRKQKQKLTHPLNRTYSISLILKKASFALIINIQKTPYVTNTICLFDWNNPNLSEKEQLFFYGLNSQKNTCSANISNTHDFAVLKTFHIE